ncbi:MAG: hypothetical protein NTW29_02945 [Bacteroidetes bacterium]|nr:hypothetical protein [Bacteroidota bacterium]
MKKTIFLSLLSLLCLVTVTTVQAQETTGPGTSGYKTSLGVRLSSANAMVNNAVSIKHFINDKVAIEGLFSFGDPLAIGAMVELHKPLASEGLSWFYGGGAYIGFVKKVNTNTLKTTTDPNFGGMGVVGLDYKFPNIPLNLSLDWKPELNIVSDINFEPAAIGFTARFTFGK